MNELEKLRKEMNKRINDMVRDLVWFDDKMHEHLYEFRAAMNRAREIERQAGIGEEK